jgi:hypothetical protein
MLEEFEIYRRSIDRHSLLLEFRNPPRNPSETVSSLPQHIRFQVSVPTSFIFRSPLTVIVKDKTFFGPFEEKGRLSLELHHFEGVGPEASRDGDLDLTQA